MQSSIRSDTLRFDPELHRPRSHRSGPASGEATDDGTLVAEPTPGRCCPYFERNDERCQSRFSIARLSETMDVCLGNGASGCLMYHRLRTEEEQGVLFTHSADPAPVILTHDGDSLRLRPTGS
ncbi:MAG: hypothetical protein CMJ52_07435 [Planctomycetaceae bacterium]|nr:hypothetical protein [Planctomycetaceae bacterium]